LVDLDAALDKGSSRHTIETIIQSVSIPTQVGGGIRKQEDVERWLSIGADRVILGTLAYENPGELQKIITTFGPEKIVVALDYKNEMIVTHGWVKERALNVIEAINNLHAVRAGIILATATQLDGMAKGPDLVMVRKIRRLTAMRILASGGIRTMRDIQELEHVGVEGVIAGRALYEGTLRISDVKV
jgi:phosphoribosylformimino-5-aminoimidazole carboxamide ribotide isomerase